MDLGADHRDWVQESVIPPGPSAPKPDEKLVESVEPLTTSYTTLTSASIVPDEFLREAMPPHSPTVDKNQLANGSLRSSTRRLLELTQ